MKTRVSIIMFAFITAMSAQAAEVCQNVEKINKVAEKALSRSDRPYGAAENAVFTGSTTTGRDKWVVSMSVKEECLTTVIVYTKKGTCEVVKAVEVGPRDCG